MCFESVMRNIKRELESTQANCRQVWHEKNKGCPHRKLNLCDHPIKRENMDSNDYCMFSKCPMIWDDYTNH